MKGSQDVTNKIYYSKRSDMLLLLTVTILFIAVCVGVLAMPKVSVDGARSGLMYSFGILIPSLFPFMFLSNFAFWVEVWSMSNNLAQQVHLSKRFGPKPIFSASHKIWPIVVLNSCFFSITDTMWWLKSDDLQLISIYYKQNDDLQIISNPLV